MASSAIVWFRRDLRLHDHPALHAARAEFDVVIPVFVLDDALLHGRYASGPRTAFMLGCLEALDGELAARGSGLVIRHGRPEEELVRLAEETGASAVFWTSDVAPYALARDRRVRAALGGRSIESRPHGGNYIVDVSKVTKGDGGPYGVFSPFHRAQEKVGRRELHGAPRSLPPLPAALHKGEIPTAAALGCDEQVPEPFAEAGEPAARKALTAWLAGPVASYADRRHGMGRVGVSGMSPWLRWGCLSPLECETRAARQGSKGARAWIRQLAWRDFYAHVLLHHPANATQEHRAELRGRLAWSGDEEHLAAWQEGRTGYPLVDAGMRQLARTGWMHNRVRLVVGSFLAKDLHLDWRDGERHFARLLLDGEPAQNNGNWQWIASTGVDPAPVFRRLYNPTLQAERIDPAGDYIRHFCPELARVPLERLYEPWQMSAAEQEAYGCTIGRDYPEPIVDHAQERKVALARYGEARG